MLQSIPDRRAIYRRRSSRGFPCWTSASRGARPPNCSNCPNRRRRCPNGNPGANPLIFFLTNKQTNKQTNKSRSTRCHFVARFVLMLMMILMTSARKWIILYGIPAKMATLEPKSRGNKKKGKILPETNRLPVSKSS